MKTLRERIDSIIAAFEAGAVIAEHGPKEKGSFTMYARDFDGVVHMGKPRHMTCDERMS